MQEDLTPARLIVGVKQVPPKKFIPNRTYIFFSHTIKAQEASMPMLDEMLQKVGTQGLDSVKLARKIIIT